MMIFAQHNIIVRLLLRHEVFISTRLFIMHWPNLIWHQYHTHCCKCHIASAVNSCKNILVLFYEGLQYKTVHTHSKSLTIN